MLKRNLLTFLLLLLSTTLYGQSFNEELYSYNPQLSRENLRWDLKGDVDIIQHVYSIHEKEAFFEVNQYLTLRNGGFWWYDSEEQRDLFANFKIDKSIHISNVWIWIGDQIIEADIVDNWSVEEDSDSPPNYPKPSAKLIKRGSGKYEMHIHPFDYSKASKIRFSYLIPKNGNAPGQHVKLPQRLRELSEDRSLSTEINILYWTEKTNPQLTIEGFENVDFVKRVNESNTFYSAEISRKYYDTTLTVGSNVATEQIATSTYKDRISSENYYSVSILPSSFIASPANIDAVFLIDLIPEYTTLDKNELLSILKQNILSEFSEEDRILLLAGGLQVHALTKNWINADSVSVDSLFSHIDESKIGNVPNLNKLITVAIDSLSMTKHIAKIGIISSSQNYNRFSEAEYFLDSIIDYIGHYDISISIADILTKNKKYSGYRTNISYYGNEYLYENLAKETSGNFFRYGNYTMNSVTPSERIRRMIKFIPSGRGQIKDLDLEVTTETGDSFNIFNAFSENETFRSGFHFSQIGKYNGGKLTDVNVTGIYQNEPFNQRIVIEQEDEVGADSTLKRYWTGHRINEIEEGNPTNEEITEAIELSLDNRILSKYTAFLALEPSDTVSACATCFDESQLVDLEEPEQPERIAVDSLYAYPNPFNPTVTINIELTESWDASNSSISIYNLLGKRVARLNTFAYQGRKEFSISWSIHEVGGNLATGIYFVRLQTPNSTRNLKITYIK